MLGFLVAIATELASGQSVWSQLAGKYVDQDLIEKPIGASVLFYGFAVIMIALASFAPQVGVWERRQRRWVRAHRTRTCLLHADAPLRWLPCQACRDTVPAQPHSRVPA